MIRRLTCAALVTMLLVSCRSNIVGSGGGMSRNICDGSFPTNAAKMSIERFSNEFAGAGFKITKQVDKPNTATFIIRGRSIDADLTVSWTESSLSCQYDARVRSQSRNASRELDVFESILKRVIDCHGEVSRSSGCDSGRHADEKIRASEERRTMPSSRTADPRHASCGAGVAPRVAAAHG